ncbi:putative pentatricopeptide repeat-containing protein At1g68930 [Selaginella moellendorffii]|uniref:putative pentatricopeptide repeat-containing protein At1g68930 n=1 Tax=Selaginella moellendorffii TaxID=88036 RepID=UPI000D1C6D3F|nr:putative pentatricopeptide repeat-containing protein At1g68930 [Selaginella moellendorffii]|eukprot:XP_024537801.1 putative pentatricopeptide repeat-containing protein At1g68930 [Selaginella moellendorffii]
MYGKCNELDAGSRVFSKVRAHDVVSWTALIVAYTQHGRNRDGGRRHGAGQELQGHKGGRGVECDDHGLRAGGYSRAAVDLYDMMKQRGLDADESTLSSILSACAELKDCQKLHVASKDCSQSPVVLNALIKMYASCGEIREAKAVFKRMKSCLRPRW